MGSRTGVCFWCGGSPDLGTRDHVFPRNLFLEAPLNLITVPACQQHNAVFSIDEEYFRDFIVGGSYAHPEARQIWEERSRPAFRRSRRYGAMILSQVTRRRVRSPLGLFLGHLFLAHPDHVRIERVFRKIMRGLYCHHYKEQCALGPIELKLWQISPLNPPPPEVRTLFSGAPTGSLGHVVYRFATEPDLEPTAIATASFFDRMHFVFSASRSGDDDRLSLRPRTRLWIPKEAR